MPIIMYASPAWSPRFKKDARRLQAAQNKFLRRVKLRTGDDSISLVPIADLLKRTDRRYFAKLKENAERFTKLFNTVTTRTRSGAVVSPKATAMSEKVRHLYPWRVTDIYSDL